MTYNLMFYPSTKYYNNDSNTFVDRAPVLKEILESYQPDLFMVCELGEAQAATYLLDEAIQTPDNNFDMATFTYNQSSSDTNLQQMVYFNTDKLNLIDENSIITNVRDIKHYTFTINTVVPITLEVFVSHLKSSQGATNEQKRLQMILEFRSYLESIPSDSYVIFAGDFNFYKASESAYQELMNPSNSIVFKDPIDSPGHWHENTSFKAIHTQSPLTSSSHFQASIYNPVTGGMDDRFDFILVSENIIDGDDLKYIPDSYKAYGNNGNCFNDNINDTDCDGEYSQDLRNLLHNMSDHIPVVMELEAASELAVSHYTTTTSFGIASSNYSSTHLKLHIAPELIGTHLRINNQLGQVISEFKLDSQSPIIYIDYLPNAVYYLSSSYFPSHHALKFVKI